MMNYLTRAKDVFLALPVPAQWTIISLAKSVLASTLMSLLAIYATAIFAIRHGFRVPVEGVPFLHLAIALATFITFAGTIALFSIMMLLLRYLKGALDQYFNAATLPLQFIPATILSLAAKKRLLDGTRAIASLILASTFTLILSAACLLVSIFILLDASFAAPIVRATGKTIPPSTLALLFGCYSVFFSAIWCVENKMNWMSAQIIASMLIFVVMAVGLFANDVYGSFIRIIRYGGGIASVVRYVEGENKTISVIRGNLLILTATHAVMFESEMDKVVEIALKNVAAIEYQVHPSWRLPNYEMQRQKDFIDLEVSRGPAGQH